MHKPALQSASPTRVKRVSLILFFSALLIPLCLSYHAILRWYSTDPLFSDYGVFYLSSQFYAQSAKDPYTNIFAYIKNTATTQNSTFVSNANPQHEPWKLLQLAANLNPPFFVAANLILSTWQFATSFILWSIFSIVSALSAIYLLIRFYAPPPQRWLWFLGTSLVFFSYFPTYISLQDGQLGLILFCLLTLVFCALKLQQAHTAGLLLGLALAIKPLLGLFVVLFLLQRRWRLLSFALLSYSCCFGIGMVIFGYKTYLAYYHCLHHIAWFSYGYNASSLGFLVRFFGLKEPNVPLLNYPVITQILYYCLAGIITLLWLYYNGKNARNSATKLEQLNDWQFATTIVITLLISPLGWLYYFPWLLICCFVCYDYLRELQPQPQLWFGLSSAIGLSALPMPIASMMEIKGYGLILLWYGAGFYALLLFGLCLIKLRHMYLTSTPTVTRQNLSLPFNKHLGGCICALLFIAPYTTIISLGYLTQHAYQMLPTKQISELYFTE